MGTPTFGRCAMSCCALGLLVSCNSSGVVRVTPIVQSAQIADSPSDFSKMLDFRGRTDGKWPIASVTVTSSGAIIGTASFGGKYNGGTVYELVPAGNHYEVRVVYAFSGGTYPDSQLVGDPSGTLYGTTLGGAGSVFELVPSAQGYTERTIYAFRSGSDGAYPEDMIDLRGTLYGVTGGGGIDGCPQLLGGCGTVFELQPTQSGFSERIIYRFKNCRDGAEPIALTAIGDTLYGATPSVCGNIFGTIFRLVPSRSSFEESTIYRFVDEREGIDPTGLTAYRGSLFGATDYGGDKRCIPPSGGDGCGTVFEILHSGASFKERVLYRFKDREDGASPDSGVIMGASRVLYGTTYFGGATDGGTLFALIATPNGYKDKVLHSFTNQFSPNGLALNQDVLYGTSTYGGTHGHLQGGDGTVFRLKI